MSYKVKAYLLSTSPVMLVKKVGGARKEVCA